MRDDYKRLFDSAHGYGESQLVLRASFSGEATRLLLLCVGYTGEERNLGVLAASLYREPDSCPTPVIEVDLHVIRDEDGFYRWAEQASMREAFLNAGVYCGYQYDVSSALRFRMEVRGGCPELLQALTLLRGYLVAVAEKEQNAERNWFLQRFMFMIKMYVRDENRRATEHAHILV